MRLLLTKAPAEGEAELRLDEFFGNQIPRYAILSHTWAAARDEVSFADVQNVSYAHKAGVSKVRGAIQQARRDGYDYIWIDSACIDKSSSSELSEAINSMFRWYRRSETCYVLLSDVPDKPEDSVDFDTIFCKSRWWTRGWTLQELIGPRKLEFFTSRWRSLGKRDALMNLVIVASGIQSEFLDGLTPLKKASVARRMSWMASRTTTRQEDIAYCLLGIFDVNMPMIYGEGLRAFMRLQEEIIKITDDHSIFAWLSDTCIASHGLLADHPRDFAKSGSVIPFYGWQDRQPFAMTNMGLNIQLLFTPSTSTSVRTQGGEAVALACRHPDHAHGYLAIKLGAVPSSPDQWTRVECGTWRHASATTSTHKIFVRQETNTPEELVGAAAYQCVVVRSVLRPSTGPKGHLTPCYDNRSSTYVRQSDSHCLPEWNSIQHLAGNKNVPWDSRATFRVFPIGLVACKIYGLLKVIVHSSDESLVYIFLGRMLNGELGFSAACVRPQDEVNVHITDEKWIEVFEDNLTPMGSTLSVSHLQVEAHAMLRHGGLDQIFDVDVIFKSSTHTRGPGRST